MYGYCATLGVDLNTLTNPPTGNWIVLANGSWNDWGWGVQLTDEDADGIYIGTICDLSDGDYGYVYSITGDFDNWSNWGIVSNPPVGSECDYNPNDNYPNYGFKHHKGYPTKIHLDALKSYGVTEEHRLTFKPVRDIYYAN